MSVMRNHNTPKRATRRFKKPRRIKQWCEETRTSPATAWRRVKDGTLLIEYYGNIPFIVAGPAGLFDDGDEAA